MNSPYADDHLNGLCNPQEIRRIYTKYRKEKLDSLLATGKRTRAERAVAGEDVDPLDELFAEFPVDEHVPVFGLDGRRRRKPLISIPVGADGVSHQMFEREFEKNIRSIAKRLADGTYLFHPFREVVLLKEPLPDDRRPGRRDIEQALADDKVRILSIATIRDAIAQRVLYEVLEPAAEAKFRELDKSAAGKPKPVSFAYRKGKSPAKAAQAVYRHMHDGFVYVLDADLRRFFDTIPHDNLLGQCGELVGQDSLAYRLLKRFVKADRVEYLSYHWARDKHGRFIRDAIFTSVKPVYYDGDIDRDRPKRCRRTLGVPQGGVLSGLLANLYLHPFDAWVVRELGVRLPLRYVRYADDFVILTQTWEELEAVYAAVRQRLNGPVAQGGLGLFMHPYEPDNPGSKTRLVPAGKPIKFVGFEISPNRLRVHPKNIEKFKANWTKAIASEQNWRERIPDAGRRLRRLIQRRLRYKIRGRVVRELCQRCGQERERRRSWIAFFSSSPDWRQIRGLEQWMRRQVYRQFRDELPGLTHREMRGMRYPSVYREYQRVRELNSKGCPHCARIARAG